MEEVKEKEKGKKKVSVDMRYYFAGHILLKGTLYGPKEFLSERDKRFCIMNREEYVKYMDKVEESDGFDVDGCTGCLCGGIVPVRSGSIFAKCAALFAVEAQKKEDGGRAIEFVRLLKANEQAVGGIMYYLTFIGIDTETADKEEKTYRAKVWGKPTSEEILLMFEEVPGNDNKVVTRKKFVGEDYVPRKDKKVKAKKRSGGVIRDDGTMPLAAQRGARRLYLKELLSQNPQWKYAQARNVASETWRQVPPLEQFRLYREAKTKYFKKMHNIELEKLKKKRR